MNHILYTVLVLKPMLLRYILVDITIQSRGRQPRDSTLDGAVRLLFRRLSPGTLSTAATLYAAATPAQITDLVLGASGEGPVDHRFWIMSMLKLLHRGRLTGYPILSRTWISSSVLRWTDGWIPWDLKTAMNGVTELLRGNISDILNVGIPIYFWYTEDKTCIYLYDITIYPQWWL